MSEVYNESAAYWQYPTDEAGSSNEGQIQAQNFNNIYIKPYLKYTSTNTKNFTVYYSDKTESYLTNYLNKVPHFLLADGMFLEFVPHTDKHNNYRFIVYTGTTNRKNSEFTEGKNLFAFTVNVNETKSTVGLEPQWYLNWSCQKLKTDRETFIKNCTKNQRETSGVSSSVYCTYMIYCNNWKIPDDYPWIR